jgi:CubicO group peptidase (beta-lactamase class C family)
VPFATYAAEAVLTPLGMADTTMSGSPAWAASGSAADLCAFGRELLAPTLISDKTLATATTVAFPGLTGILPGFGRQEPNDWGLGFELRDHKAPHWTGTRNSPATFGHFGRTGTFLWVDPEAGLALVGLTDRDFGPWAAEAWPALSDAVLAHYL